MKYIRTKDKIIDTTDTLFTRFFEFKIDNNILRTHCFNEDFWDKEEIINQADTIEELCDDFVLIRDAIIRVYPKKHLLEESITGYCVGDEVYGAIWTNKGLIYVAKMNEEGCLELL